MAANRPHLAKRGDLTGSTVLRSKLPLTMRLYIHMDRLEGRNGDVKEEVSFTHEMTVADNDNNLL